MSELFSYASEPGGVWSDLAAEIHTAVWDGVGLEKVQGFVRQWAKDWNGRRDEANKQAQDDFERTGKGVPEIAHCSFDGGFCRFPNPCECSRVMILPALPCSPDDPELPLPPNPDWSRSPVEKWASLAAIHDVYRIDGDKINLWPVPADFRDVSVPADEHFLERTRQWVAESLGYGKLIEEARGLSQKHKSVIERWLKELVEFTAIPPLGTHPSKRHSQDFTDVWWDNAHYSFTATQARAIKILWQAWETGASMVRGSSIVKELDLGSTRTLATVFQKGSGKAAWGKLIIRVKAIKGAYCLNDPDDPVLQLANEEKAKRSCPRTGKRTGKRTHKRTGKRK